MIKLQPKKKRYLLGIVVLLVVVLIWVSSSFVISDIFADLKYNKPFFITYINTSTFSFYLIPYLFKARNKAKIYSTEDINLETQERLLSNEDNETNKINEPEKLSTKDTFKLGLTFCFLWFLANYTTNASLAYTSVASSTILSSMSGLFTLGLGAFFKVEKLNLWNILSVLFSIVGVALVSYSDQDFKKDGSSTSLRLVGDILALAGAFFYGCYTTFLKFKIGDESRMDMSLFFGFVGTCNVVLLWPLFLILHWLSIEQFEFPYSGTIWLMVLLNAFIGSFLSDYLWLLAMLMTSPLVVTLGISLTIPLALVGDLIFKHSIPGIKYIIGATLVIIGFLFVNKANLSDVHDSQEQDSTHDEFGMDEYQNSPIDHRTSSDIIRQ